ncbi:MAG: phosphatase PAP2 family protein [Lachnospiraceae bacterium]|nr:phosphatase PAP2 family protein [Lachnospiraceae bacterium]
MEWEVRLIEWIQDNFENQLLGKFFSFLGGEMGLLLLLLIVMFCWNKETGKRMALTVASLNVWLPMLKAVVMRPRPYIQYPDRIEARVLVESGASAQDVAAQGYSFPSMHSASVTAAGFTLAKDVKKKWLWITATVLSLLVGVSRAAVGMHFPTDILAGWALGFAVIGIFTLLERYISREWIRHLILLVSMIPGLFFVRTQDYYTSFGLLIGAVAAIPFEHRYVRYENTRHIPAMILRTVGAFVVYFVLNTLLKLPFSKEYLASATLGAFLIRMVRYAVIMFVIMGVYPKIFPQFEKIGKK